MNSVIVSNGQNITGLVIGSTPATIDTLTVQSGGMVANTTVNAGGELDVVDGGTANSTTFNGGRISVTASILNGITIRAGAQLKVGLNGIVFGVDMDPLASADFLGIPYSSSATGTFDPATDVYTVTNGGTDFTFQFAGGYAGEVISRASDGSTGTLFTVARAAVAPGAVVVDGPNNTVSVSNNTVYTSAGPNTVLLGTGTCTVFSNGADTVFGGTGPDSVTAGGNAVVVGGTGALTFQGGPGHSVVFSGAGGLTYTGGRGYDLVVGNGNSMTVQGGNGGGQYWGSGSSKITAGSGAQAVLVGMNGDQLYSAGGAGDFLVATGGDVLLSGIASTGNDVMIGTGTGRLTFIAGSGNDLIGLGEGHNMVTLGTGHSTIFARGASTINMGLGSADIALSGQANLVLPVGSSADRSYALFNFIPGADRITLQNFDSGAVDRALANQVNTGGNTVLMPGNGTTITLVGIQHVDASAFG